MESITDKARVYGPNVHVWQSVAAFLWKVDVSVVESDSSWKCCESVFNINLWLKIILNNKFEFQETEWSVYLWFSVDVCVLNRDVKLYIGAITSSSPAYLVVVCMIDIYPLLFFVLVPFCNKNSMSHVCSTMWF